MGQKNTIITIKDRKRKDLGTVRKNMQLVPTDLNNSRGATCAARSPKPDKTPITKSR